MFIVSRLVYAVCVVSFPTWIQVVFATGPPDRIDENSAASSSAPPAGTPPAVPASTLASIVDAGPVDGIPSMQSLDSAAISAEIIAAQVYAYEILIAEQTRSILESAIEGINASAQVELLNSYIDMVQKALVHLESVFEQEASAKEMIVKVVAQLKDELKIIDPPVGE